MTFHHYRISLFELQQLKLRIRILEDFLQFLFMHSNVNPLSAAFVKRIKSTKKRTATSDDFMAVLITFVL